MLVGDEPEPPYSRMAIPYLLIGNIGEAGTHLRKAPDHFAEPAHHAASGGGAAHRHAKPRTVALDDGGTLRLRPAAAGHRLARRRGPPIPGIDLPSVLTCWTLADARKIVDAVQAGRAGAAAGRRLHRLHHHGSDRRRAAPQLTVVEMGDRMVPRMMTAGSGRADQALVRRRRACAS